MVWEVTHDAIYLGYLGLAQGVPLVVFQLWGGVLADRANRLRLLLGTQILTTAVLIAAFGALLGIGLGLLFAWAVVQSTEAQALIFSVPWARLVLALVVAVAASVLAAV